MVSSRVAAALLSGMGLIGSGATGVAAWQHGLWGLVAGAILVALWLVVLNWSFAANPLPIAAPRAQTGWEEDAVVLRVLLDFAPTPLLAVNAGAVYALNRAARAMFATDDYVIAPPPSLLALDAPYLRHAGQNWRIDRVQVARAGRTVVALIDIEREEQAAEARATAELIHVLGHELLNGLAPIVSLAESALAAANTPDTQPMLPDILGTLARRAEGLQRFTEAYRALARLPEPVQRPVSLAGLTNDLARLFRARWPGVALSVEVPDGLSAMLDGGQISQALWAILQNAAQAALAQVGAASVSLGARREAGKLIIEISDSGAGVSPHEAAKIFRSFYTTKPEGTGVGLSLARQIVYAHGGTVVLLPGKPTTFCATFPAMTWHGD
ncbi:MAG: HAMP domain-containing sensor histidine kinase [Sphingomonas sp.]|jgi:signal transduction histidine kinase